MSAVRSRRRPGWFGAAGSRAGRRDLTPTAPSSARQRSADRPRWGPREATAVAQATAITGVPRGAPTWASAAWRRSRGRWSP